MKKFLCVCLCGILAAAMVTGCSKQEEDAAEPSSTVKLGEYKGITYTPASTEVTDEDVDAEVQSLLDAHPAVPLPVRIWSWGPACSSTVSRMVW